MMRFNGLSHELTKLDEVCCFNRSHSQGADEYYSSYVSAFIYSMSTGFRLVFVPDEFLIAFKDCYREEFESGAIVELMF